MATGIVALAADHAGAPRVVAQVLSIVDVVAYLVLV